MYGDQQKEFLQIESVELRNDNSIQTYNSGNIYIDFKRTKKYWKIFCMMSRIRVFNPSLSQLEVIQFLRYIQVQYHKESVKGHFVERFRKLEKKVKKDQNCTKAT